MIALRASPHQIAETAPDETQSDKPLRLLDIFEQLESGEMTEDQAVEALRERRLRRYGRVGRLLEAIAS